MPADQSIRPSQEILDREVNEDLLGRSEALYNVARTHRYLLIRRWATGGRTAVFVMLNPSTATASEDDNTVRRCTGYARREGCNALVVVNLFALRATKPAELYFHPDPVGPRNDEFIDLQATPVLDRPGDGITPRLVAAPRLVVAAWGTHGRLQNRGPAVAARLVAAGADLRCLGRTVAGEPIHPRYQKLDEPLVPYVP
jgi:hypothetical protein